MRASSAAAAVALASSTIIIIFRMGGVSLSDDVSGDVELVENLPDEMKEQVEVEIFLMLELAVKHGRHSENCWGVTTLAMSVNVLLT